MGHRLEVRCAGDAALTAYFTVYSYPPALRRCRLPAWALDRQVARRDERSWVVYSAISGGVFVVTLVLASAGFAQAEDFVGLAGLFERVDFGFGRLAMLAASSLRSLAEG